MCKWKIRRDNFERVSIQNLQIIPEVNKVLPQLSLEFSYLSAAVENYIWPDFYFIVLKLKYFL